MPGASMSSPLCADEMLWAARNALPQAAIRRETAVKIPEGWNFVDLGCCKEPLGCWDCCFLSHELDSFSLGTSFLSVSLLHSLHICGWPILLRASTTESRGASYKGFTNYSLPPSVLFSRLPQGSQTNLLIGFLGSNFLLGSIQRLSLTKTLVVLSAWAGTCQQPVFWTRRGQHLESCLEYIKTEIKQESWDIPCRSEICTA